MSKGKRFFFLALFFVLFAGIYWGVGNTPLTVPVTYVYYALCLILSVFYVLVAGGLRPILEEDRKREKNTREKYLKDKGKMHPVKRRDKYRRFTVKKEEGERKTEAASSPAPNLLKIPEEMRGKICQRLLLVVIPLYIIFLLDWLYLHFFI